MKIKCKNCEKTIENNLSGLCIDCKRKKDAEDKINLWKETGNTGCNTSKAR